MTPRCHVPPASRFICQNLVPVPELASASRCSTSNLRVCQRVIVLVKGQALSGKLAHWGECIWLVSLVILTMMLVGCFLLRGWEICKRGETEHAAGKATRAAGKGGAGDGGRGAGRDERQSGTSSE